MKKTLFEHQMDRLEACKHCPCCRSHRTDLERNPEFFRNVRDRGYLFAEDMQISARFYCGAEFSIDRHERFVANTPCTQPAIDAALRMQEEAGDRYIGDLDDEAAA